MERKCVNWLALDIGGANLKVADGRGYAASRPFPLWRAPDRLTEKLREIIAAAPAADRIAATMTGELADCFRTKAEGVRAIVESLSNAAHPLPAQIYLVDGRLATPELAAEQPLLAAASNWHALARFAARFTSSGVGILIDIGSTTCDIIPLVGGRPAPQGFTDTARLLSGELVYTGVERSPVCALLRNISYRGRRSSVAQELFATASDAYLVLGDLPEEPDNTSTADGRPATRAYACERLARMACADSRAFTTDDAVAMARAVERRQTSLVAAAVRGVVAGLSAPPETVVLSGRGEFLARRVFERLQIKSNRVSLSEELGPTVSQCAPAHALAVIAREGTNV